ncbi:MAG: hypothetical protein NT062_23085 [Proteobacteria bacterium]|nr:hypothetical protein [Pseudomonadota bacterium]
MRNLPLIAIALAACGGAPAVAPRPPVAATRGAAVVRPAITKELNDDVDLFTALGTPADGVAGTWIAPAPLQLEPGATTYAAATTDTTAVRTIERQGSLVRVALRLDALRFGAWIDRGWVLAIVAREQVVAPFVGAGGEFDDDPQHPIQIALLPGARVRRLAHKDGWTQIRYVGELEANGWVPDTALVDERTPTQRFGRQPGFGQPLMLMRGAVFRSKPDWSAREIALANGAFVTMVRALDANWVEITYGDDDVRLHAYVARQLPPGRMHRPSENDAVQAIVPNAIAPSGTCLYAREGGEPIGYVVGDQPVQLDESGRDGWWSLLIATPWSGLPFVARGPQREALVACAPAGSVPAPSPTSPAIPRPSAP